MACRGGRVRTVGQRRASTLGACKGPLFNKKSMKTKVKEEKDVGWLPVYDDKHGGHPRSEFFVNVTTDAIKKTKKSRLKIMRASKNLVGPGHPTASTHHCQVLTSYQAVRNWFYS